VDYGLGDKVHYFYKSLFPDKKIKLNSLTLALKQPFISENWHFGDFTESFRAEYPFGTVTYAVVHDDIDVSWDESKFRQIDGSHFKNICAIMYEISMNEGPIYAYYDLVPMHKLGDLKHGYEMSFRMVIPYKKMILEIKNTRANVGFLLDFAKPFICKDIDFEHDLIATYYGGHRE
jgi:hypothetical protein